MAVLMVAALSPSLAAEPGTPATAMQGSFHATIIFEQNLFDDYNNPHRHKTTVKFLRFIVKLF